MPRIIATEEDWLREGLRRFSSGGVNALRVEAMSRTLKCSKSSFYHYFQNRTAFVHRMLERWAQHETQNLAQADDAASPGDRFRALMVNTFSAQQGDDFLFHLRHLAQENEPAARLLAQTETRRINDIAQVLVESGMRDAVSQDRAELIYGYALGWHERNKHHPVSQEEREASIRRIIFGMGLPASLLS